MKFIKYFTLPYNLMFSNLIILCTLLYVENSTLSTCSFYCSRKLLCISCTQPTGLQLIDHTRSSNESDFFEQAGPS